MKIIYVGILPPHNGGSAMLNADVLVGLANRGHQIQALSPITETTLHQGDTFAARHPELGIRRFIMPYSESSPDMPSSEEYREGEKAAIVSGLNDLIAEDRPDVILIGRETFVLHITDIARLQHIPIVMLMHGTTTFGILRGTLPKNIATSFLEKFRQTDLIVAVAEHLAQAVRELGLSNVRAVPNTIDTKLFSPKETNTKLRRALGISDDDIVAAHISNLKALKRPFDLVHSAVEVLRSKPQIHYLIVGDGMLRQEMEALCKEYNLDQHFHFTGWVEREKIPEYIGLADMVIMPSEAEARALVYLETQACGRLLIASDIPAAREAVTDGETGLLFEKGNIEDLTAKTLLAANNPQLRLDIGNKARQSIEKQPLNQLIDTYEEVFKEVIQSH